MSKLSQWIMLGAALSLPGPALGQMLDAAGRPSGAERRVTAGITIPLGTGRTVTSKPQLELRASSYRPAGAWEHTTSRPLARERTYESRIGMTLEPRPQLTVAGREVPEADRRLGLSTLGWVAIGVVAAGVVGGLLFIDAVNDASD